MRVIAFLQDRSPTTAIEWLLVAIGISVVMIAILNPISR